MKKLTKQMIWIAIIAVALCTVHAVYAAGGIPRTLNFQAKLTDSSGAPLEGSQSLAFKLYDAPSGGTMLWQGAATVTVNEGVCNTVLGPFPETLTFNKEYYLDVSVAGQSLSPRQKVSASPYALNSERLAGLSADSFVRLTDGKLGIGTMAPNQTLEINGVVAAGNTTDGVWIRRFNTYGEVVGIDSDGAEYNPLVLRANSSNNQLYLATSGEVGIGTVSPQAKLDVNGRIVGGFGAETTSGILDWNDKSNSMSGSGYSLLRGSAANGPGSYKYFHPFNFEYSSKDGTGNITQFAIPYSAYGCKEVYYRGRYNNAWTPWRRLLSEIDGKVGIGTENPSAKLHVAGNIKANGTITGTNLSGGDFIFRDKKTDKVLWRMVEDEKGLYLVSEATGKKYRIKMEEME